MTNLQRKITTALATGAVLANALVPMTFANTTGSTGGSTSLTISGNGSDSDSNIDVNRDNKTTVNQTNVADVRNNIDVDSDTGGNSASDNTGGDVQVRTGNASTNVEVNNLLNSNQLDVANCGGCAGDLDVVISGNGSDSDNDVDVDFDNDVRVNQTNVADVDNDVDVDADTGNNDVDDNTGGDVRVRTGDVSTDIRLSTIANANSARIGGSGDSDGGAVSAHILGNGSDSDNDIDLDFDSDIDLDQVNVADIDNDVDVDADSGDNDVEDNTGGDVVLRTGDIDASVIVDNMVNFNAANVEDCCFEDLTAKIAGNGSDSDNEIDYDLDNELDVDQVNTADLDNDLDVDGDTGDNDVDDNTGAVDAASDPALQTGNSDSNVEVSNTGGYNAYGDVELEFDWSDLLEWFHSLSN
jgi:hypothetical protein